MDRIDEIYKNNNSSIDTKLDSIHKDLKLLIERSNQEYLDLMLDNLKRNFQI